MNVQLWLIYSTLNFRAIMTQTSYPWNSILDQNHYLKLVHCNNHWLAYLIRKTSIAIKSCCEQPCHVCLHPSNKAKILRANNRVMQLGRCLNASLYHEKFSLVRTPYQQNIKMRGSRTKNHGVSLLPAGHCKHILWRLWGLNHSAKGIKSSKTFHSSNFGK